MLLRGRLVLILFLGGPGGWCQLADFFVRGAGDALEDVGEVGVWVDAASATAFYDAVDDGAAVAGVSSADKEPVLLADGCGAHGVFGIDRSIVKAPYHNYADDEPDDPYEDENNWLWSDAKYKWVYHAPNKGKGKAKKGKGKGKKGKGKSKGKQHGRRRKRRTAPGMVPQHLQSTDSALIYLNQIQTKAIIQLLSQIRTLTSIIITTIIGSVETSPIKEVIEERDDFAGSLQESRTKAKAEGTSAEPQGDPKYGYMVGFAEAVVQLDGIDSRHQQTIQEWLDTVYAESDDDKPATIAGACTHFTIHPVANQTDKFRLQIAIPNNALRHALVSGLSHLDSSILKVTSGPAQESFFEEELADWLSVLQI